MKSYSFCRFGDSISAQREAVECIPSEWRRGTFLLFCCVLSGKKVSVYLRLDYSLVPKLQVTEQTFDFSSLKFHLQITEVLFLFKTVKGM